MNPVKDMRLRLSLTQDQLAGFLGISRSQVNMVEQAVRELENKLWLRLVELVTLHEQKGKAKKAKPFKLPKQHHEEIARHARKMESHAKSCQLKADLQQAKLDKMKQQYEQIISWLQTVELRLAKLPATEKHAIERKWLEMEQAAGPIKLRQCGELEQGKLRRKVHLLRAAGEINNVLHNEMK